MFGVIFRPCGRKKAQFATFVGPSGKPGIPVLKVKNSPRQPSKIVFD